MNWLRVGFLLLVMVPVVRAEVTVSLRAVAKNGIPIEPTSVLSVIPNDEVTAEVYLSGWGTPPFDGASDQLHSFQLSLAGSAGALSSGACPGDLNRMILPEGWDAPIEKDQCPCDQLIFPTCSALYGCTGPAHHPEQMATIPSAQTLRRDFVFFSRSSTCSLDVSSLDIRWSCALNGSAGQSAFKCQGGTNYGATCATDFDCSGSVCHSQFQHYVGSVSLRVGSSSCNAFSYSFLANITKTSVSSAAHPTVKILPSIQGLTLLLQTFCPWSGGACCTDDFAAPLCSIVACPEYCAGANQRFEAGATCSTMNPPCLCDSFGSTTSPAHCSVDARVPFLGGNPASALGIETFTYQIDQVCPNQHDIDDYVVTQLPSETPPLPPTIAQIEILGHTVTITLTRPINPNRWTCILHIPTNRRVCTAFLPGDADGNLISQPSDILALIDHLNGVPKLTLPPSQCDIDRSGSCAPLDVVYEIDLLNGTQGFPRQNGAALPPCPSEIP